MARPAHASLSARARRVSRTSPAAWPKASLYCLKPSRSNRTSRRGLASSTRPKDSAEVADQRAAVGQAGERVGDRLVATPLGQAGGAPVLGQEAGEQKQDGHRGTDLAQRLVLIGPGVVLTVGRAERGEQPGDVYVLGDRQVVDPRPIAARAADLVDVLVGGVLGAQLGRDLLQDGQRVIASQRGDGPAGALLPAVQHAPGNHGIAPHSGAGVPGGGQRLAEVVLDLGDLDLRAATRVGSHLERDDARDRRQRGERAGDTGNRTLPCVRFQHAPRTIGRNAGERHRTRPHRGWGVTTDGCGGLLDRDRNRLAVGGQPPAGAQVADQIPVQG